MRFSKLEIAVVLGIIILLITILLPAIESARRDARRSQIRNQLKQIGIALHDYHDTYRILPQAVFRDEHGKPQQGWLTSLLPFMESSPLFDSIDLGAPWDGEANRPSFSQRSWSYESPGVFRKFYDESGYGLSHFAGNTHVIAPDRSFRFEEISDGTNNTLIAGEAFGNFEPWGKPGNVRDPIDGINQSRDGFGTTIEYRPWHFGAKKVFPTCQFVFVDGTVRALSQHLETDLLRGLALPEDGEGFCNF